MKKYVMSAVLFSVIVMIFTVSCKKPYNSGGTTQSRNQLFSSLRYVPQIFSVTAGRDTVILCNKGTLLHFYAKSFKDADGNILSGGTINLQVDEMYKCSDMVRNRATTTTGDGRLLQSGGQVNITATSNGQEVFPNVYGIAFKHSAPSISPMALFYGNINNPDSTVKWTQSNGTSSGTSVTGTADSLAFWASSMPYYSFDSCTVFHWANCDWFNSNDSPRVAVSVVLPDSSFNSGNTDFFLMLPFVGSVGSTLDTVIAVLADDENSYSAATNTMHLGSDGAGSALSPLPAGLHYELIVVTNKNGSYYYYEQSGVVPHTGLVVNAAMGAKTPGDIVARLEELP